MHFFITSISFRFINCFFYADFVWIYRVLRLHWSIDFIFILMLFFNIDVTLHYKSHFNLRKKSMIFHSFCIHKYVMLISNQTNCIYFAAIFFPSWHCYIVIQKSIFFSLLCVDNEFLVFLFFVIIFNSKKLCFAIAKKMSWLSQWIEHKWHWYEILHSWQNNIQ